jgi:hypothetical protein
MRKRRQAKKQKQIKSYCQCDKCDRRGLCVSKKDRCAYLECMARADGTIYECPDYEPEYWEKLCA